MKRMHVWISAALIVAAAGCAQDRHPKVGQGRVSHVVLCWMNDPADAAARARLIETSESFRTIPGIQEIVIGRPIASTRPVVDSSYDLSIVILFDDAAALAAYEVNPKHAAAVRDVLRPQVKKFLVYDGQERSLKHVPDASK